MDLGLELPDVLGFAATWVYAFWPVLVLAPLAAGGSRRKSSIPAMLTAWGLAALAGIVSTVMNIPKISLIPEPSNTLLFIAAGIALVAVFLLARRRQGRY